MSYPFEALKLLGLSLVFYSVAGCGGELIRLGDGNGGSALGGKSGSAGSLAGAGGFGGSSAGSSGCAHAQVPANQVVWIGDSWVIYPAGSPQYTFVRDQARAIQAIGPSDDYVNLAAAAASMDAIAKQYATQESGPDKVRVLIMDGGTWDAVAAQTMQASVPDALAGAEARFRQFLADVASDGTVEHIVYFLVPPLSTVPGVDTLRPELQADCEGSAGVHCHFIDLKDAWADHPEYTGPSGIQPSTAGATEIGALIWQTMRDGCIAQ